jgi:hypothetical protein
MSCRRQDWTFQWYGPTQRLFWAVILVAAIASAVAAPATDLTPPVLNYPAWDIALTPGEDESHMNIAWHTSDASPVCAVQIVKVEKGSRKKGDVFYGTHFGPEATPQGDNYNKATVSRLKNNTNYEYRLGDGGFRWSEPHALTTHDPHKYSFLLPAFSYISVDNATLSISTYGCVLDQATQEYSLLKTDTYTIVKDGKRD